MVGWWRLGSDGGSVVVAVTVASCDGGCGGSGGGSCDGSVFLPHTSFVWCLIRWNRTMTGYDICGGNGSYGSNRGSSCGGNVPVAVA